MNFVGYGPTAPAYALFLGIQEKADGHPNLVARSSFASIEDLWEAHEHKLKPAGVESPFDSLGDPVRQWNMAARFVLALQGHLCWLAHDEWSRYWREKLGRKNGDTFLMECCPFPAKSYGSAVPAMPGWSEAQIWECRSSVLRAYLGQNPPTFAIAYGGSTKKKVESLFFSPLQRCDWISVPGTSKMPASVAFNGRTRIAHVGFFGQGCFSSGDIPAVVSALRGL